MLKSSEVALRLIAIRDKIDTPDKWCKGYARLDDRMCLNTALNEVLKEQSGIANVHAVRIPIYAAIKAWCNTNGKLSMTIITFNDHHTTTHKDIMCVLDTAISLA